MEWIQLDKDIPGWRYGMKFSWMKTDPHCSAFFFHKREIIS
jgi:hypothetical protein